MSLEFCHDSLRVGSEYDEPMDQTNLMSVIQAGGGVGYFLGKRLGL